MRNWAGNLAYHARAIHRPRSIDELRSLVRSSRRVRALGTRHAFNGLADTDADLVSLRDVPRVVAVDVERRTVTIDGGATYTEVTAALDSAGFALPNLASLPHISVAGAVATATHGSGNRLGSLASSVVGLELARANGELESFGSLDAAGVGEDVAADDLAGAVVALGALGIVTRLALRVEPTYDIRQVVFEDLPFRTAIDNFDELSAAARSVSLFTDWSSAPGSDLRFHQVWLKERADVELDPHPYVLRQAAAATVERHPIPGFSAESCTPQLGVPGPWHERLPHFRADHRPSAGDELQSEFIVDRRLAGTALEALAPLAPRLAPLVWVTEIRTIAADRCWLSPAAGRDSVAIHFTWRPRWKTVAAVLGAVETALAPLLPRPHWGKLFSLRPETVREAYADRSRFVSLARRLDPDGVFRNAFVDAYVLDAA